MRKHFELEITDSGFSFRRKQEQIDAEAALDGIHVLRTSVPPRGARERRSAALVQAAEEVEPGFARSKGDQAVAERSIAGRRFAT